MLDMGITPRMLASAHDRADSTRTRSLARKGDRRGDRETPAARGRKTTRTTNASRGADEKTKAEAPKTDARD